MKAEPGTSGEGTGAGHAHDTSAAAEANVSETVRQGSMCWLRTIIVSYPEAPGLSDNEAD